MAIITLKPQIMSIISDAIVETLLVEITDYCNVQLSEEQHIELNSICDRWEDRDSIESEINGFLYKDSYLYDYEECAFYKPNVI
jgi:hypothetical protein